MKLIKHFGLLKLNLKVKSTFRIMTSLLISANKMKRNKKKVEKIYKLFLLFEVQHEKASMLPTSVLKPFKLSYTLLTQTHHSSVQCVSGP